MLATFSHYVKKTNYFYFTSDMLTLIFSAFVLSYSFYFCHLIVPKYFGIHFWFRANMYLLWPLIISQHLSNLTMIKPNISFMDYLWILFLNPNIIPFFLGQKQTTDLISSFIEQRKSKWKRVQKIIKSSKHVNISCLKEECFFFNNHCMLIVLFLC